MLLPHCLRERGVVRQLVNWMRVFKQVLLRLKLRDDGLHRLQLNRLIAEPHATSVAPIAVAEEY
jgi:hypothetical protein